MATKKTVDAAPEEQPKKPAPRKGRVEKDERKFVKAKTGEAIAHPKQGHAKYAVAGDAGTSHEERAAQAKQPRMIAIVLWVLGLAAEIAAVVFLKQNKTLPWIIAPLVIDLILVVAGSQFWKRANHIDPPAKGEGFMYWVKTELGMIIAVLAFFPIVILLLTDKNADKKTRNIGAVVAAIALVIAGASGIDYHPATQEGLDEALEQASMLSDGGACYWTAGGEVYHFNPDCQALVHSAEIFEGDVQTAFEEGKTRGCKFCTVENGEDVLDLDGALDELAGGDEAGDEVDAGSEDAEVDEAA